MVGISPDPYKPSYFVSDVLQSRGFKLYLVNPHHAGRTILGEKVYASLQEVPDEMDFIDVGYESLDWQVDGYSRRRASVALADMVKKRMAGAMVAREMEKAMAEIQ